MLRDLFKKSVPVPVVFEYARIEKSDNLLFVLSEGVSESEVESLKNFLEECGTKYLIVQTGAVTVVRM